MVQILRDQPVPATYITQLPGHKNLKSMEDYSLLSTKQQ